MSLQDFDVLIDKMNLAFEYAENLGQYVEAAKILFQINNELPSDLQIYLADLESPDSAKAFITKYRSNIKLAITQYRQRLEKF